MYLGKSLVIDGRTYPMTGIFPFSFSLEKKPQAHGYSIAEVRKANPFYPEGTVLKGHEVPLFLSVINPGKQPQNSMRRISILPALNSELPQGMTRE